MAPTEAAKFFNKPYIYHKNDGHSIQSLKWVGGDYLWLLWTSSV